MDKSSMKRHLSIFLILVTFVLSHVTGMKWISVIRSLATKSAKLYKLNQQPGFCSGSVTSTNFLQQSFRIINSKTFLILISLPSPLHFSWIVVGAQIRLNIQKEAMQWLVYVPKLTYLWLSFFTFHVDLNKVHIKN